MPHKPARRREPTPKQEGAQIVEAAAKAGADYAGDQLDGDYFRDWVHDQMVEAEQMRKRDPSSVIPLETPADARKVARNMLQQLEWDTHRQLDQREVFEMAGATGVFGAGSDDWVRDEYGITRGDVTGAFFEAFDETLSTTGVREWLTDLVLQTKEDMGSGAGVSEARQRRPDEGVPDGTRVSVQAQFEHRAWTGTVIGRQGPPAHEVFRLLIKPDHGGASVWRRPSEITPVSGRVDPQTWAEPRRRPMRPVRGTTVSRMARDQEHSGGFTISFYNQDVIESNAEDSYGPRGDKEHRKNAMRAGFTDAGGGITEKGWGQLNKDIAIMERNSVAWLKKKFVNARDEGHGGHGGDELIGTVWYDTSNPEQAHLLLLGVNDRIDMTDLSYGDASVWKGVSPFGSVLGGAINFFDIPDSDLEKAEETEGRRKRSSKR